MYTPDTCQLDRDAPECFITGDLHDMIRIGLTGGIGSGKTTVAGIFEVLGIPVYYADLAAKRLMQEDEELKRGILDEFGPSAYQDGRLNRNYISSLVFADRDRLNRLNSLVHPATMRDSEHWMQQQQTAYALKEAALIFESHSDRLLDYVIGVSAPERLRIERTIDRDRISVAQVMERMKQQMDEGEKMKRCDFIIYNDEVQAVLPQVLQVHAQLLKVADRR